MKLSVAITDFDDMRVISSWKKLCYLIHTVKNENAKKKKFLQTVYLFKETMSREKYAIFSTYKVLLYN